MRRVGPLRDQQRRDQEAAQDEERVDAEVAADRPRLTGVVEEHRGDREGADPVERGLVPEVARGAERPRRPRRRRVRAVPGRARRTPVVDRVACRRRERASQSSLPGRSAGGCPVPASVRTTRPTPDPGAPQRCAAVGNRPWLAFHPAWRASRRFLTRPRPDHRRGRAPGGSITSSAGAVRASPHLGARRRVLLPRAGPPGRRRHGLPQPVRLLRAGRHARRTASSRPRCTRRSTPCSSPSPPSSGSRPRLAQRILTALLGTATVFLIGLLAPARSPATGSGSSPPCSPPLSPRSGSNDSMLGLETLYGFLPGAGAAGLYRVLDDAARRPVLALVALWLALATLTRSEGTMLFVAPRAARVRCSSRGVTRRDRARSSARHRRSSSCVVIVGPWVVRNLTTFEKPTLLGTGFGWVLARTGTATPPTHGQSSATGDDSCALEGLPAPPGRDRSSTAWPARRPSDYIERPQGAGADRGRGPRRRGCSGRVPPVPERAAQRMSANGAVTPPVVGRPHRVLPAAAVRRSAASS